MNTFQSIADLIGHTPLVRLKTGIPEDGPAVFVKLEFYNPTGSVKDRMVYHILKKALDDGRLSVGDTVVDNTSGNTGTSLGMAATLLGLKAVISTPEKTSKEKVDLIKSFGVEVIITPTEADHDDPEGCYLVARNLARDKGYFDLNQYDSPDNIESHYLSTGPEIWDDTDGQITHLVIGIGTGGTLSGTAKYLKEQNPDIHVVAVDPEGSIFAEYIKSGQYITPQTYKMEGIGSDVLTRALMPELIDEVITVSDRDAFVRARLIARSEAISAGGSSGAVAIALEQVARKAKEGAVIVGIFADGGIRYLSKQYNDEWMLENGYLAQIEAHQE